MNTKTILAVPATAIVLTLLAYFTDLSSRLPEPYSFFAVAILAAGATPLLTGRSPLGHSPGRHPGNANTTRTSLKKETGSVKWFSASKGFGFITRDNGEDIFVHFRSITGNGHRILHEGQRVEFAVTNGSKGLQAEEVAALK
jgi:CspA family cold shock protein